MTNLTDAQLTALSIEHYPNPDDPDGCWSCCEAWVCPTAEALGELRQVREQKRYSDAGFASTLKRAVDNLDVLRAENERLRGARLLAAGFADQFRRGLVEIRDVPGIDARAAARNTLASVKETTRE